MSMTTANWNQILRAGFRVPDSHQVYILGSFARRVTLYSQQVRALNLVYALFKTGKLDRGREIAVVGGGAAGLTAAAGAAFRGARVTLFDEVEGPMELQQNNRQRWIHPYIYDWPYLDESGLDQFQEGNANLPLLTWKADYAANVAQEITSQWERLRGAYDIKTNWSVRNVKLDLNHPRLVSVKWDGDPGRKFHLAILAVGFGLEPRAHGQDSYWTEDDLDGGFRKPPRRPRWLLSGSGDGALTDLMRLCVHRFRQDEMLNLFVTAQGIEGLKRDLRALQANPGTLREQEESNRFAELGIDNELRDVVKDQLRRDGPKVVLVSDKPYLYGPRTSQLNRLVVRILAEMRPKAFEHVVGTTEKVSPKRKVFLAKIRTQGKISTRRFDRVLLRHGTDSKLKRDFPSVHRSCKEMASFWKSLPVNADVTRRPNWKPGYFGPLPKRLSSKTDQQWTVLSGGGLKTQDVDFAGSVSRFGVYAESVSILKQIRSDGSSTVTYTIDGLSVLKGTISGVHFRYNSAAGTIVQTKLESRTRGLKWVNDDRHANTSQLPYADLIEEARIRARRLSGTVRFPRPIRPNEPISFRLIFRLLNGDAFSDWEFSQMYDQKGRQHMDAKRLSRPAEYLEEVHILPSLCLRIYLPKLQRQRFVVDLERDLSDRKKLSFLSKEGNITGVDTFPTLTIPVVFAWGDTPDWSRRTRINRAQLLEIIIAQERLDAGQKDGIGYRVSIMDGCCAFACWLQNELFSHSLSFQVVACRFKWRYLVAFPLASSTGYLIAFSCSLDLIASRGLTPTLSHNKREKMSTSATSALS